MEYRIKSIKHSGKKGERGTDRTDDRYPMRIGRTVEVTPFDIVPGVPLWINYLKDSDGSDYSNMTLRTSFVVDVDGNDDLFTVETNNSIFEFERVGD